MESGEKVFYLLGGLLAGAILVALAISLRVGPFALLSPSYADASKLFIVAVACAFGALGGFTHDIVQNKRFWQNAMSTPAGYFLGSKAGIFLGVISGLLVGLLLPPYTASSTAAYAGLTAGIALKGLAEAASTAPPSTPALTLTSDPPESATVGGDVKLTVVLKKSDGTAAASYPITFGQNGMGSLENLQGGNTDAQGQLQITAKGKTAGGVVVNAFATVENQPVSSFLTLTIT
jgi:hypothetical protein